MVGVGVAAVSASYGTALAAQEQCGNRKHQQGQQQQLGHVNNRSYVYFELGTQSSRISAQRGPSVEQQQWSASELQRYKEQAAGRLLISVPCAL